MKTPTNVAVPLATIIVGSTLWVACTNDVDVGKNVSSLGAPSAGDTGGNGATGGMAGRATEVTAGASAFTAGKGGAFQGGGLSSGKGGAVGGELSSGKGGAGGAVGASGKGGAAGPPNAGSAGGAGVCGRKALSGSLETVLDDSSKFDMSAPLRPNDIAFGKSFTYVASQDYIHEVPPTGTSVGSSWGGPLGISKLAVLAGPPAFPAGSLTSGHVDILESQSQAEKLLALRKDSAGYADASWPTPQLLVDGGYVYWSQRLPGRVVEASLTGGVERIVADYSGLNGLQPTAITVDAEYLYWATARETTSGVDCGADACHVMRTQRGIVAAPVEVVATLTTPILQMAGTGDFRLIVHLGGPTSLSNVLLEDWSTTLASRSSSPTKRISSGVVWKSGSLFWTEWDEQVPCSERLVRQQWGMDPFSSTAFAEVLIIGLERPANLIVHGEKLFFSDQSPTLAVDPWTDAAGAVYAHAPTDLADPPACVSCLDVLEGRHGYPCGGTDMLYLSAVSCGVAAGCDECSPLLADASIPASPECLSCLGATGCLSNCVGP